MDIAHVHMFYDVPNSTQTQTETMMCAILTQPHAHVDIDICVYFDDESLCRRCFAFK